MDIETVITAALRQRVEYFEKAIQEAQKGAVARPAGSASAQTDIEGGMVVDCSPTPEGYAGMARAFEEEKAQARDLLLAIEEKGLPTVVYEAGVAPGARPRRI